MTYKFTVTLLCNPGRKSTPDEVDTRYRGNSISWSLSSRVCMKTGWTLRRPRSSVSRAETYYLTEKILDDNGHTSEGEHAVPGDPTVATRRMAKVLMSHSGPGTPRHWVSIAG